MIEIVLLGLVIACFAFVVGVGLERLLLRLWERWDSR